MELPSCMEEYEPPLVLTVDDRRHLIKGLAESGTRSIGKFIIKHEDDRSSGIAKLVKRLRARLEHQMLRARASIKQKYKQKHARMDTMSAQDYLEPFSFETESKSDTKARSREMDYFDRKIDSRLIDILSHDDVLKLVINLDEEPLESKLGWWARLREAFQRVIWHILDLFRRFITWLKIKLGRKNADLANSEGKKPKQTANILLRYPSGTKLWDNIDNNLDNALATSPSFKRTIEADLAGSSGKQLPSQRRASWHKHFASEKENERVRSAINKRIKRVIKREERRLAQELQKKKRRVTQLHKDKTHQALRKREQSSRLQQLEKQKAAELDTLKHQYQRNIHRSVEKALSSELEDAGYLHNDKKNELKITTRLIDRFAELVLSDELAKLPSKHSRTAGTIGLSQGIYEKKKLRTSAESSRMDIVSSMVNARLAHPGNKHIYDSDIITYTDIRSTVSHVVLIFDKSGSMEENDRIQAAKKSVLALYKAVKHRNPRNIVDFIAFDSTVQVMDILQAWHSTPSGFTNTGEALSTARELIKDSHADRKLIYLITDGLPEAYTDPRTGVPRAGDLEKSLSIAVREAKKLKKIPRLKLTLILLEPEEEIYTEAANTIVKAVGGDVIVTDPNELATEMLMDYIEI